MADFDRFILFMFKGSRLRPAGFAEASRVQRATRNPQHATRNPQRLHLLQIFSNDAADLISVSGQNIIGDFFGGAF